MSKMNVITLVVGMVGTNCYLVYDEETKRAAVVDPGDRADQIMEACSVRGLKPEAILLTHGHFDHIMAVPQLKAAWNVPVYAAEKEAELLKDRALNMSGGYNTKPLSLEADVSVKEGDVISAAGFEWTVLETPGHTSGSCCYYIEKEQMVFTGDTMFRLSYGRTDLPTGSMPDIARSVKRLLTLPEEVIVYPGHMDSSSIGHERIYNPLKRYEG